MNSTVCQFVLRFRRMELGDLRKLRILHEIHAWVMTGCTALISTQILLSGFIRSPIFGNRLRALMPDLAVVWILCLVVCVILYLARKRPKRDLATVLLSINVVVSLCVLMRPL